MGALKLVGRILQRETLSKTAMRHCGERSSDARRLKGRRRRAPGESCRPTTSPCRVLSLRGHVSTSQGTDTQLVPSAISESSVSTCWVLFLFSGVGRYPSSVPSASGAVEATFFLTQVFGCTCQRVPYIQRTDIRSVPRSTLSKTSVDSVTVAAGEAS